MSFCASLLGCQNPISAPIRPNILLVTFDTTRWDHVGWQQTQPPPQNSPTPMLDAMAQRGTWFSHAFSSQPLTLPSHTSIMTGQYPYHHGVRNNGTYIVPDAAQTLAERLKAVGYQTQAVISSFVLDSQFGLDQGFDGYDDDLSTGPRQVMFMFKEIKAEQTAAKGALWLRERTHQTQPFFLWMHFFDPHANYEPPESMKARFPGDPYTGEIAYADHELGRVFKELDELKQLDNTLVIFTSDHGDSLGEHGEKTHGLFVYDSTTRVPLLMSGPGVPRGGHVDGVVSSVDIVPTVMELLGLGTDASLDGRSLVPLWSGKSDIRQAYSETFTPKENFGWAALRALRTDDFRAIQAPKPELYAHGPQANQDATESQNLLKMTTPPADGQALLSKLDTLRAEDPAQAGRGTKATLNDETRRKLNALGYVTDQSTETDATGADPKDRIQSWELFQTGQELVRQKRYDRAVILLRHLLATDPDNITAKGSLAQSLLALGLRDQALKHYQEMIAKSPHNDAPYLAAARILRESKQFEDAHNTLQALLALQPKNPDVYTAMGDLYLDQNQFADAEKWFRQALAVDAHSTLAAGGLGNCLNRANRLDEARAVLTEALRREPSSHTVTYNLAVVSERMGDIPGAEKLYLRAVQLEPDHSMSWNNLGSLRQKQGKLKEAIECIKKAHELDPDNAEALYNLGSLLILHKRTDEALPYLAQVEQKRPDLLQAWLLHARTLETLGRTGESLDLLTTLAKTHPPAWLMVARQSLAHGDGERAQEALKQGLAADGQRFRQAVSEDKTLAPWLKNL